MEPLTASDNPRSRELDDLYRHYGDLVFRTAYGVTKVKEDAEDVRQIVFLRLLKFAALPNIRRNPKAYFYRAALNLSLDVIRSRQRESSTIAAAQVALSFVKAETQGPESALEIIHKAMEQLDDRTKSLLSMRYVEERSDSEIARLLGKTRGSVAVRLFRARSRVRTFIE
jgi:RNA polymerase sigma-70 factor, ECF subfamily